MGFNFVSLIVRVVVILLAVRDQIQYKKIVFLDENFLIMDSFQEEFFASKGIQEFHLFQRVQEARWPS